MSIVSLVNPYVPNWNPNCTTIGVKLKIAFGLLGMAAVFIVTRAQTAPPKQPGDTQLISSLKGPDLYQAYCAVCHGKTGKGDGPMAIALRATPSDLTRLAMRNGGRFPKQRVEGILLGEVEMNTHGTKEMPLWGPIFSQVAWDQDLGRVRIDNLAKYIETLQGK
ncbi:MAG TPA: cytochrome c [Bryobacteraceae bacterium]